MANTAEQKQSQADPQDSLQTSARDAAEADRRAFRREAAMRILEAYVAKHGGFEPAAMEAHVRQVWAYADIFVAMEDAPPLPVFAESQKAVTRRLRPVHPSDEFAVIDADGKRKRGFITAESAEEYASGKPGSKVVQVSGPEAERLRIAPAFERETAAV